MKPILFHNIDPNPDNEWTLTPEQMMSYIKPGSVIHFDDARSGVYKYAFELLAPMIGEIKVTIFVPPNWINGEVQEHEQYSEFMTWDQLEEMHDAGFMIGSHGLSHHDMRKLSDEQLEEELSESKNILEDKFGECNAISYPYGLYDMRVIGLTRRYYKEGFGLGDPEQKNRYNFPRDMIRNTDFKNQN